MDTNEEIEEKSRVQKLHIKELVRYPSSFWYEYSVRGMTLQNSPSLWSKKEENKIAKGLKHTVDTDFSLSKDTLLHMLSFLDFQSLIRCMLVNRSMFNLIRSPELKRLWSENQSPVVLISSYTLPCKLWQPGPNSSSNSATIFPLLSGSFVAGAGPLENALVAASHRGLVCIRFENCSNLELVVGNPLTREWKVLPTSENFQELCGYRYKMEVMGDIIDQPSHFKVAGFSTSDETHFYHVFDSASGEWSSTSLDFPPRSAFRWSEFDLRSSSWRTELIPNWVIKTGLERTPSEVHRLPHPTLHSFCQWEYNGSTYLASPWTVEQAREDNAGEFAGYGVWKKCDDQGLETVGAVWGGEVGASLDAIRNNVGMNEHSINCSASANLVCFGGESSRKPTMPVVLYDIDLGRWTGFDEQQPASENESPYWPGDHYASAVIYSPSLLVAPASFPEKDNPLLHVVKRLEQSD